MARGAQMTREGLARLGIDKLTTLILDETALNGPFKKRVAAALASAKGPDAVAAIVDRRLAALERARGPIGWDKTKELVADLKATAATIVSELGPNAPEMAFERMVRFLACAGGVVGRAENPAPLDALFIEAQAGVAPLVAQLPDDRRGTALERLIALCLDHAVEDDIIEAVARSLPGAALASSESNLRARLARMPPAPEELGANWRIEAVRASTINLLQLLADIRGDIDAIVALEMALPGRRRNALGMAERLLAAGRPAQALEWVRTYAPPRVNYVSRDEIDDFLGEMHVGNLRATRLEVRILEAKGERDAAQSLRWATFERDLDVQMLRDYIVALPDFEEFDELDRAFALARSHERRYLALRFLTTWPRLDLAAAMVVAERAIWKGRNYRALRPVAEALEDKHPLAATILYRALLDDIVETGKSQAYPYAATYLLTLDGLDPGDMSAIGLPSPDAYRAALRKKHGRKYGFWNLVDGEKRGT